MYVKEKAQIFSATYGENEPTNNVVENSTRTKLIRKGSPMKERGSPIVVFPEEELSNDRRTL